MTHAYFSQRKGANPNLQGLPLADFCELFVRVYGQLVDDGYFVEAFGFHCVDADWIPGKIKDVPLAMLLAIRKKDLWPINEKAFSYTEDDLFDVIEFLCQHVSKPIDGHMHSYGGCGMHWETFNQEEGRHEFRDRMNEFLGHYQKRFELSLDGEILHKPEAGFEPLFNADVPSSDDAVVERVNSAVLRYRRHGASVDDRRQAVRDLADVLEYLRPKVKQFLATKDEQDLFMIVNNFGIRHHNQKKRPDTMPHSGSPGCSISSLQPPMSSSARWAMTRPHLNKPLEWTGHHQLCARA